MSQPNRKLIESQTCLNMMKFPSVSCILEGINQNASKLLIDEIKVTTFVHSDHPHHDKIT